MFDPQMMLLGRALEPVVALLASAPDDAEAWSDARRLVAAAAEPDSELAAAIEGRDAGALKQIVDGWTSGRRMLCAHDRDVLKRAMKAFRKSLKVTRLDAESTIGGGPMSAGRDSGIVGIVPPSRYPREVWDELARQGRLVDDGRGTYELGPNA